MGEAAMGGSEVVMGASMVADSAAALAAVWDAAASSQREGCGAPSGTGADMAWAGDGLLALAARTTLARTDMRGEAATGTVGLPAGTRPSAA